MVNSLDLVASIASALGPCFMNMSSILTRRGLHTISTASTILRLPVDYVAWAIWRTDPNVCRSRFMTSSMAWTYTTSHCALDHHCNDTGTGLKHSVIHLGPTSVFAFHCIKCCEGWVSYPQHLLTFDLHLVLDSECPLSPQISTPCSYLSTLAIRILFIHDLTSSHIHDFDFHQHYCQPIFHTLATSIFS